MKQAFQALVLAAATVALVAAQPASGQYGGHGYAVFSLGAPSGGRLGDVLSFGGGGEGFLWKGLAVGTDLNYLAPRHDTGEGIGLWNLTGGWHFTNRTREQKVVPFLSGGYTLAFRSGTANLINYGGGINYWFRPRLGLRIEVRDYRHTEYGRFNTELRFGMLFR
jgi:hypothetical protein